VGPLASAALQFRRITKTTASQSPKAWLKLLPTQIPLYELVFHCPSSIFHFSSFTFCSASIALAGELAGISRGGLQEAHG
jgi:hypothetical protein